MVRRCLPSILLLLFGCVATRPQLVVPAACTGVRDPQLCAELLMLRDRDQEARKKMLADRNNVDLQRAVEAVDAENVKRVVAIIEKAGWPGKTLVGEKGSGAAWTILQHSDAATRKRFLPLMQAAVASGELHGSLYATTVDRVRIGDGLPQLYGTQFREQNGRMEPFPIENEAEVDARRASVGLQPLSEYAALINETYLRQKQSPH